VLSAEVVILIWLSLQSFSNCAVLVGLMLFMNLLKCYNVGLCKLICLFCFWHLL